MADPSKRELVLRALRTRLEAIKVVTGSETDIGRVIYLNETPQLSEDDPDCIAIVTQDDEPEFQGEHVTVTLPIEIQAIRLVRQSDEDPWTWIEALIADIKRAVELSDRTFGGLLSHPLQFQRGVTRTLEREPGSNTVGAGITYRVFMKESWGAP